MQYHLYLFKLAYSSSVLYLQQKAISTTPTGLPKSLNHIARTLVNQLA